VKLQISISFVTLLDLHWKKTGSVPQDKNLHTTETKHWTLLPTVWESACICSQHLLHIWYWPPHLLPEHFFKVCTYIECKQPGYSL